MWRIERNQNPVDSACPPVEPPPDCCSQDSVSVHSASEPHREEKPRRRLECLLSSMLRNRMFSVVRVSASDSTYGPVLLVNPKTRKLEEHCVNTNPERRTEEQAEETSSGGTTPVVDVGIEGRLDARHGFDSSDPERNPRLGDSTCRHRAGCHTAHGCNRRARATRWSSVHTFAR